MWCGTASTQRVACEEKEIVNLNADHFGVVFTADTDANPNDDIGCLDAHFTVEDLRKITIGVCVYRSTSRPRLTGKR